MFLSTPIHLKCFPLLIILFLKKVMRTVCIFSVIVSVAVPHPARCEFESPPAAIHLNIKACSPFQHCSFHRPVNQNFQPFWIAPIHLLVIHNFHLFCDKITMSSLVLLHHLHPIQPLVHYYNYPYLTFTFHQFFKYYFQPVANPLISLVLVPNNPFSTISFTLSLRNFTLSCNPYFSTGEAVKPWYKTNPLPLKIRNNLVIASKNVTLGVTLTFANLTLGRKGDKKVKI